VDIKYINPFIIAAQTVFKTMLGISAEMGKPALKNANRTSGDVTGIMGLVGDKKGTVAISLREAGARFVYKTLVGEECDSINQDVVDAIGEITNIVGKEVEMNFITKIPIISLPFYFSLDNDNSKEKEVIYIDFSFE